MDPDFAAQLKAVREDAGLFDAQGYGHLIAQGPDAAAYLHRLSSNEVQKMKIGEGRYHAFLDRKGMVLSLFFMIRTGEQSFHLVTPPQLAEKTFAILKKFKFTEKVDLQDRSSEDRLLILMGPKAEAVVQTFFGKDSGLLSWKEDIFKVPVLNALIPQARLSEILETLKVKIPQVNESVPRLLKMEIGFPEYGVDIDETHILLETAVPVAHVRQKGCYPGQEVVERISAYGKGRAPRSLCVFFLEGHREMPPKTPIETPDGQKAGFVTSSLYDPLQKQTIVLGYLEHKFVEKKDQLRFSLSTGTALLHAMRNMGERTEPYPEDRSVSGEHNFFLYGDGAKK